MDRLLILVLVLAVAARIPAQNTYQNAVNKLAASPAVEHGQVSICVIDVESGHIVASHDARRSVVPASNLKILTTASALVLLQPDYRFRTVLQHDGQLLPDGRLSGNLYLYGTGDPTLGSPLFEGLSALEQLMERLRLAVQQLGIRRIEGEVIGDASLFGSDAYCHTWQWEDMGNYYGAGAWSLNIHENLHYLHFQQSAQEGATPSIAGIEPEVPGLRIANEVHNGPRRSGDNAYIFGAPYQFERYVRGSIPAGTGRFTIKGSLPNPPLLAAQYLQSSLSIVGIPSAGARAAFQVTGQAGRTGIYTHYSPPLAAIVERANMESVNLYCEALLKVIGWEIEGEGNSEAGRKAIESYWQQRGLEWDACHLEDGSGLSESNRVSSFFLARLLQLMASEDEAAFQAFYRSLPEAGRSGSLKTRLKGTAAEGRLRAKSGTLEHVRAYSGYATARNGKLLAFSAIINNYEGAGGNIRQQLEAFMLSLCQ